MENTTGTTSLGDALQLLAGPDHMDGDTGKHSSVYGVQKGSIKVNHSSQVIPKALY